MGRTQKKNSKGRLDRYYHLAKEKGYRARSAFKVIQINEKYGHFLEKSKVVIDLCAAPGSWCQVASKVCPVNSLIIGVDIVPIKPLPNCITVQADITTDDCKSKLRGYMKTWKADTVLHDGAPNVGLGWVQDAFTQSQLTLQALKLAVDNLSNGGTFVTKIFRSRDYNSLLWVFQQFFDRVEATKPPSSRNVSAEIFVVCKGFKAPKKIDPRLLDPKEVFEELGTSTDNNEAKVFNPEKKKRKRDGYEEGDYTLYHEVPVLDFIKCDEPIKLLGSTNKLLEPSKDDNEWKILKKIRAFTPELLECMKDLKVLGKKEFKLILKFRKSAREILGLDEKDDEKPVVESEPLTEDQQIDQELKEMRDKQAQKLKRSKKHANEVKQKEIQRMQMNMLTDMNIGIDAAQNGSESLFNLKTAAKTGELEKLSKGKRQMILKDNDIRNNDVEIGYESDAASQDELDQLETQLDSMYQSYKERRAENDAKFRSKIARGDDDEIPWNGIEPEADDEGEEFEKLSDDGSSDSDDDEHINRITNQTHQSLSRDAKTFFDSDKIFKELTDSDLLNNLVKKDDEKSASQANSSDSAETVHKDNSSDDNSDSDFEIVQERSAHQSDSDSESEDDGMKKSNNHEKDVELATVEAMTLAHQVALGQKSKYDLVEEGINRYSFRDHDGLPDWFIDDEKRHSKLVKPITKEAAAAIKEKEKQLNARPIKKVLEAKGRKKIRALKRLEKLKKKSDLINEDSGKSESDKAQEIQKLMKKLSKKQNTKPKTTLVVANGSNRGLKGRPKGIKGKYKMVDGVMKKEQRALKRISKKHKK
ncbi:Piso0_005455 [Millerozyma farinosa CBS 7064]|uniref:Piso0_005455 protein n=1 Tax=Pichia sorbitophila (strain ATCC MYA-4447 / BCRC 22081 / CBS 7064 / NBRC 10061 / NRRL Y-12695) TaxID=559304 RepID=G8Y552_PICSO|nr:Piso0_005455 [Millerozyma farinosa CBS 7064]